MSKANFSKSMRREGNSDTYKYGREALAGPTATKAWAVTHFTATAQ